MEAGVLLFDMLESNRAAKHNTFTRLIWPLSIANQIAWHTGTQKIRSYKGG